MLKCIKRLRITPGLTQGVNRCKLSFHYTNYGRHTMYEQHGETKNKTQSRIYRIWRAMRHRCTIPASTNYARYGGRGIKVCYEWLISFPAFKEWAFSNGYAESLTLDRVDNDGDYQPSNCRWVSAQIQSENKSRSCIVEINGVSRTVMAWADVTGIIYSTLYRRYHRGVRGKEFIKKPAPVKKGGAI